MPEKMSLDSMNIAETKRECLKQLFPEAFSEGAINFDELRRILGEWVDPKGERFGLHWTGKANAVRVIQQPSVACLSPERSLSEDFDEADNIVIQGDNLECLKLLQKSYFGAVHAIYIDPPYNTGNDFVYNDDFSENIPKYLSDSGQADAAGRVFSTNAEQSGRYHSNWLNMIYPRLYLAKNLLRDDGVIFISIDENEVSNLRLVCNEVFGDENFVGQVTVLCNPKGRSQDKYLANCHEYILIYSKTVLPAGAISIPKSADEVADDYPLEDGDGPYRELELRNTHREFGKHNRPNLYYPIYRLADGSLSIEEALGSAPIYPDWDDGFEGCWTWGKDKAKSDLHLLTARLVGCKWKVYRKAYAFADGEVARKQLKSIWTDKKYYTEKGQGAFNELFGEKEKLFQSPKSPDLIAELVNMVPHKNSVVLDFFAGSGTTAQAVMELNARDGGTRQFILIQIPEATSEDSVAYKKGFKDIAKLCIERVRRAAKKIGGNGAVPFKVFTLKKSNFKLWNVSGEAADVSDQLDLLVSNVRADSTPEGMLYEILVKAGFPLTTDVKAVEMTGKQVFSVSEGALLVCLDTDITPALIDALADADPVQVICLDEAFKGNDQLKANAVQTFKARAASQESEIVFRTI